MKHGVGIVGFGGMGSSHARRFIPKDRIDILGVYDIDPKRMEVAQQKDIHCESFEALLANRCD